MLRWLAVMGWLCAWATEATKAAQRKATAPAVARRTLVIAAMSFLFSCIAEGPLAGAAVQPREGRTRQNTLQIN
ncbi:hypothetical protein GCM10027032_30810 [Simplicispira piscis]